MFGTMCQLCNQRPATSHLTEIASDGSYRELHICGSCARENHLDLAGDPPSVEAVIGGKATGSTKLDPQTPALGININLAPKPGERSSKPAPVPTCDSCGLDFQAFAQNNRFGCADCYDAFGSALEKALAEIHGSAEHVGRVPGQSGRLELVAERIRLRKCLDDAIANEDYEKAAQLRDLLRTREGDVQA